MDVKKYHAANPPDRPDKQYLYKDGKWYMREGNPHRTDEVFKDNLAELVDYEKYKDIMYLPRANCTPKDNYVLLSNEFVYFGKYVQAISEFSGYVIEKIAGKRLETQGAIISLYLMIKLMRMN